MPLIRYTKHAKELLALRRLTEASIEAILATPAWTAPDPQPGVTRAYGKASEAGDRWVRVAFLVEPDGAIVVLTAHPDRRAQPPGAP